MFEKEIDKIIKYGKLSGKKGLTPGLSGNISLRCGDKVIITATATANGYLDEDDFAVIDFSGNLLEGKKPSSEKFLHLEFYKQREDVNAIMHFHSPYLTSFAVSGQSLSEPILPEIVYAFGEIPLAEYALPGSSELVENTSKYFKDYSVILMQNHGVIAGGKSLKDVFFKLDTCENYAKTLILSKILGGAKIISEDETQKIYLLRQ